VSKALDRAVPLSPAEVLELSEPLDKIEEANRTRDPDALFNYGRSLVRRGQLSGIKLAHLLALLDAEWEDAVDAKTKVVVKMGLGRHLGIEDTLKDVVQQRMGVAGGTFTKYANAWKALHGAQGFVPTDVRQHVQTQPIEWQLLLTAAASDMKRADWEEVALAQKKQDVQKVVRRVRGQRTSSQSALRIYLRRNGRLEAIKGRTHADIGRLNLKVKGPVGQAAIERLLDAAGVIRE